MSGNEIELDAMQEIVDEFMIEADEIINKLDNDMVQLEANSETAETSSPEKKIKRRGKRKLLLKKKHPYPNILTQLVFSIWLMSNKKSEE